MYPSLCSVFLDYKCNFRCAHCSVESGPHRSDPMARETLLKIIDGIKQVPSIKVVVFTGGEATLRKELLLEGIRLAHEAGYTTRIVTNAWWAKTPERAAAMVGELKAAGLDEMNSSWDDFHAPFAKVDIIANMIRAGLDAGLGLAIGVILDSESRYNSNRVKDEVAQLLGVSVADLSRQVHFLEDNPTPTGTGRDLHLENLPDPGSKLDIGCPEVVKTLSFHPYGDVKVCCGHGMFESPDLTMGNILQTPLPELVEGARHNLMYWWVHMLGPKRILERIGVQGEYTSICHACTTLFTQHREKALDYLKEHHTDVFLQDVLFSDNVQRTVRTIMRHQQELFKDVETGEGVSRLPEATGTSRD